MGYVIVKMRIMPKSPEIKIDELEKKIKKILEKENVKGFQTEIQPIAFGLKALIILFSWPEEKPLEVIEEKINSLKEAGSVDVLDMRRAIG